MPVEWEKGVQATQRISSGTIIPILGNVVSNNQARDLIKQDRRTIEAQSGGKMHFELGYMFVSGHAVVAFEGQKKPLSIALIINEPRNA